MSEPSGGVGSLLQFKMSGLMARKRYLCDLHARKPEYFEDEKRGLTVSPFLAPTVEVKDGATNARVCAGTSKRMILVTGTVQ